MSADPSFVPVIRSSAASQYGAGTVEFAIVALPFLFIGLGSMELAHWFHTRQAISVALLDAGRAAITNHNRSDHIIAAFEYALRPLYVAPSDQATRQRLQRALAERAQRLNAAPWQIELLSPSAPAFSDFADPQLNIDGASTQAIINNNYLAEQDARYRAAGRANGRGTLSGQTIYEANMAVLRLSWLHKPQLPLMTPLLKALGNPQGSYRQRALAHGYLPMARQITLMMQSHPVQWADSPDGKVIYGAEAGTMAKGCTGWLCEASTPAGPGTPIPAPLDDIPEPAPGSSPDPARPGDPDYTDVNNPGTPDPDPDLRIDDSDPLCGVVLCCGSAATPGL